MAGDPPKDANDVKDVVDEKDALDALESEAKEFDKVRVYPHGSPSCFDTITRMPR